MGNSSKESLQAWEANADFWDARMGNDSNSFHRNIVRPYTEKLLEIREGDYVLDIACGNGNFSQRLAQLGARVVAFDYSPKLIEHARRRRADVLDRVAFHVCDATDYGQLMAIKGEAPFGKAVANMAVMDISDIRPLFKAVHELLVPGGIFVFSTHHPCFTHPEGKYMTACVHQGEAIKGQPVLQNYYHRSLQEIFNTAFQAGFVLDGFYEETDEDEEISIIMIVRLRKNWK